MSGAITATVAAVAAMTTAEVFTAIAVTGAVLGAVGAATGVKPLMYAGMALGVVGGVGGLASSAGMFAGEAAAGGVLSEGGGGLAEGLGEAGTSGLFADGSSGFAAGSPVLDLQGAPISYGAEVSNIAPPQTDIINGVVGNVNQPASAISPTLDAAASPNITPSAAVDSPPVIAQGDGAGGTLGSMNNPDANVMLAQGTPDPTMPGGVRPPPAAPNAPGVPETTVPAAPGGPPVSIETGDPLGTLKLPDAAILGPGSPINKVGIASGPGGVTIGLGSPASSSSPFGSLMSFVGQPGVAPLMGMGLVAGSSFLSGATSPLMPAQVEALNAQAKANLAAANLSNTQQQLSQSQQANMSSGIPVATRRQPGIINRAA